MLDGLDPARVLAVVRTPPEVSLYHRHGNPLFARVLERLGRDESVQAVVLPAHGRAARCDRGLGLPSLHVPERAVDAQSLIALADLVVSAGGTMNREAAALGVPVYTTFAGRLGAVDEQLIRDGRLRPLADRGELGSASATRLGTRTSRDPRLLLELLLSEPRLEARAGPSGRLSAIRDTRSARARRSALRPPESTGECAVM